MASAAPFPAVLEAHARVTVQMIALSAGERGWSTERVMQLSQGVHPEQTLHVTEEIHMSWDRAPVTGVGRGACKEVHRMSENTWQQWWEGGGCAFSTLPAPPA